MVDKTVKRQVFADFCRGVLEQHRTGLKVRTSYAEETEPGATRKDRIRVMGDPAYYLEILPDASGVELKSEGGRALGVGHRVQFTLFLAFTGESSQNEFDVMTESLDEDVPGLLTAIRSTKAIRAPGGSPVRLSDLSEAVEDIIPLDGEAKEKAHTVAGTVTLT